MIAFVTLLLGLISGTYPIEVAVSGPVARVEFLLDGAKAGETGSAPWKAYVNLGLDLQPHELVARSLDATGREIARTSQWLNLPRPPAEVEIALENGAEGRPATAHLTWQSVNNVAPGSVGLTFDGRPLALDGERRAPLPKYDITKSHVLSAEVWFGPGVVGSQDIVFGGVSGEVNRALTAVPLRVQGRGAALSPSALQGRLTAGGQALNVVAVEEGPGKVVVVNVPGAARLYDRFFWTRGRVELGHDRGTVSSVPPALLGMQTEMRFDGETVVRLLSPAARRYEGAGVVADLFDSSRDFTPKDGGLLWLLARSSIDSDDHPSVPRIADAVAVAGLQAAVGNPRRAVLLLLSDGGDDASRYPPEIVRRYLASIRVPLYVWSLYGPKAPGVARWGGAEDVSTLQKLYRAFDKLKGDLETQRIVWVEGRHLPQSVTLVPGTGSIAPLDPGDPGGAPAGQHPGIRAPAAFP
jgi:hypothetical protein